MEQKKLSNGMTLLEVMRKLSFSEIVEVLKLEGLSSEQIIELIIDYEKNLAPLDEDLDRLNESTEKLKQSMEKLKQKLIERGLLSDSSVLDSNQKLR